MKRVLGRIVGTAGAMALAAACVQAQSFNLDLDYPSTPILGGGVPSSSFGAAAGQTGFWNGVLVTHIGTVPLLGLDGLPTPVNLVGPSGGSGGGQNITGNAGDYRALMSDARGLSFFGTVTSLVFSGLQNGTYRLFTYVASLALLPTPTEVWVQESLGGNTQVSTGPMQPNQFERGKTHTLHDNIRVTDHTIHVQINVPWTVNSGDLNGIQLQQVPEPASLVGLVAGALGLIRFKGKRVS